MQDRGKSNRTGAVAEVCAPRPASQPVCPTGDLSVAPVYDLRDPSGNSDSFFADVARFSAEWVDRIEARAGILLDNYTHYIRNVIAEAPRSRAEYALEFLTLGMMLRNYESAAETAPPLAVRLGAALVKLRGRFPATKPIVDRMRALLSGPLLSRLSMDPAVARSDSNRSQAPSSARPPIDRLTRLIAWLHATGEFEQETQRLANWRGCLAQLGPAEFEHWMSVGIELFDRFADEAADRLGRYTHGVEPFLAGEYAHRGLREDRLFCGRTPSEYHLNMVAAEVMNQGLRDAFERTTHKIVLVPACMKGAKAAQCRAHAYGVDITCTACDPDCAINRITRRMKAFGVRVYIVPHATGFSRWLTRWQREPGVGVAAVACMLNILPGGYEMRARRIASQCVPLDFPGCRKHWDPQGISTAVNEDRLVQIVASLSF